MTERWRSYEEAHAALEAADADDRIPILITEWRNSASRAALTLPADEMARLFVFAWGAGPKSTEYDHETIQMLRWLPEVRDVETYLSGQITVYSMGDEGERSIRWTTDERRAVTNGGKGVLRATVAASDVQAHLTAGGLDQVLVDPRDLSDIEPLHPAR